MYIVGETGISSASRHVRHMAYLACGLRYGAGKHIWKLLVMILFTREHEYAKSAFGVVSHLIILHKLFHMGIKGQVWNLIDSLHTYAETMVKGVDNFQRN